jgi:glycosyl transferase family 25
MKVFIINLKRSFTRRKSIEKECVKYKLDYEFIEAVDGRLLSQAEIKRHTRELNYACKPGEIGCSLSHLKAYRIMCARGINKALILEDDAKLTPEITGVLTELDKTGNCKKPTITLLTMPGQYRDKCLAHIDQNHGVYPVIEASLSHGYVINYPAAKKALKALYPVWMVADRWQLFKEYSISDINAVIPPVVVHSELACTSTINAPDEHESYILAKKQIWDKLKKSRPLSIKLKRTLWLLCKRNFIKIVKC